MTQQHARHRKWLYSAYATSGVFAAVTFTRLFIPRLRVIEPYGFRISDPGPAYGVFVAFFTVCLLSGLWLMYRRTQRTRSTAQRQTQYILLSHCIAFAAGIEYFSKVFRLIEFPPVDDYILVAYFVIFAYAVIRHRLLDIHLVIRKSLAYSLLIACLTAAYLVMVLIMERCFQGFFGYRSFVASLLVATGIALGFTPLRDHLQMLVDRALFHATPAELAAQREQLLAEIRKSEQQKAVAILAAGLAHEIKNPLAAIKTFTDHLEARYSDPAFRTKFQKIVGGEVERINHIVQRLLEFAKPAPPRLVPVEVPRLLDETLEFLGNELIQHHVEVERRYESVGPIMADPQQLKQAFLNLLLNSLQAMDGRHGRLTLETAMRGSEFLVTIADTGCGIAPEHLAHLGEPFFTAKPAGTGLGLAVVQGILKEHGGRLTIESQPGEGTRVQIELPTLTQ